MKKVLKIIVIIIVIIVIYTIVVIGYSLISGKFYKTEDLQNEVELSEDLSQDDSIDIEDELMLASIEKNKSLPKMLDEATQLTTTNVSGKELIFSMKIMGKYFVTQDWIDSVVRDDQIAVICNDPAQRYFLEEGATITLKYYNNDDSDGGKISIMSSDCQEISAK